MYNEQVWEHFQHPRNMGKIEDYDGLGKVGNPVCGDVMYVYIKVAKNDAGEEILEDIKFQTFGCAAAIATSSMITELALGKSLEVVKAITRNDVADALGGLPPIKQHCSNLAADAVAAALADYEEKKQAVEQDCPSGCAQPA